MSVGGPLPPRLQELLDGVLREADLPPGSAGEVADELRAHLEDGLAAGHSPEAVAEAFGDPERVARWIVESRRDRPLPRDWMHPEAMRRGRRGRMTWDDVVRELVRAVRTLWRAPGFAAVAILTLALGIGANTAVFSVVDAALLADLPYENPDRLVRVYVRDRGEGALAYLPTPAIEEWRRWDDVFASVAVAYTYREVGADLTGGAHPERVAVAPVGAGYFETLGVPPLRGRTFEPDDEVSAPFEAGGIRAGSARALLAEELWRRRFGADPEIVGSSVELDGVSYEVVGVIPAAFQDPVGARAEVWVPQDMDPARRFNGWDNRHLTAVARIRDGLSVDEANRRLAERTAVLLRERPEAGSDWVAHVEPLQADLVGTTRRTLLWILFGAVGLVLVSACVNVANLFLARSLSRRRELAVRASLGSSRGGLILHLLAEAVILSLVGGVIGLAAAWGGIRLLPVLAPDALPPFSSPSLNLRVLTFTGALAIGTCLLFALAPALRLSRPVLAGTMRGGRRGSSDGTMSRLRDTLVVAEAAVALVLAIGAGLLARSFMELQDVRLGVEPDDVFTFEVHLPDARYPDGASREGAYARLQQELEARPEVSSAGAVSWLPLNGEFNTWGVAWSERWVTEDGAAADGSESWFQTEIRVFRGHYFASLGVDLLLGQGPAQDLGPDDPLQIWVTRSFVDRVFAPAGAEPIGQPIRAGNAVRRVAGVIEDPPLDPQGTTRPQAFIPHGQFADNRNWALVQTLALRPGTDLQEARAAIEAAVDRIDPGLVVFRPRPYERIVASRLAQDRFAALLMSLFAGLALVLAAVGTYGVLSYAVGRRRREMGIRMALGASAGSVRGMVFRYGFRLVGIGVAVGAVGAWFGGRWVESLLFGVDATDPAAWLTGIAVLVLVGAMAGWVPALRATRVEPAQALTLD